MVLRQLVTLFISVFIPKMLNVKNKIINVKCYFLEINLFRCMFHDPINYK